MLSAAATGVTSRHSRTCLPLTEQKPPFAEKAMTVKHSQPTLRYTSPKELGSSKEKKVLLVKRLMALLLLCTLWIAITGYGALSGWWLTPIAVKGDSAAFLNAAIAIADKNSHGNVALVLIKNGSVLREHYAVSLAVLDRDTVNRDTLFPMASASKWLAAYGVMQLVQAGKIDLDAPVSRYLKRWQLPAGKFDASGVTVRRLLSHTAGLTDALGFGDYAPTEVIPSLEASLQQPRASTGSKLIALGRAPGSAWQYSGGGYLILQLLVEEVSGMGFAEWMQQSVFKPLDMQRASYAYIGDLANASKSYDATGKLAPSYKYASAAATGLSASAADLIKFVQAHLPNAPSALSPPNVRAMRQAHGRTLGADIWGLGPMLYAPTGGGDYVFGHDGANAPAINTAVRINPDNGDAIIVLGTGNTTLASLLAYEWTLWQTGSPDFLMLDKVIDSALMPTLVGLAVIFAMFVLFVVRQRRRAKTTM